MTYRDNVCANETGDEVPLFRARHAVYFCPTHAALADVISDDPRQLKLFK